MNASGNPASESGRNLSGLKSEAEIEKLRLEAEELRERIERGKKWYTGRYLVEATIGGLVAGALFVSWFIGFYSPSIAIQKERLEFAIERQMAKYDRDRERLQHDLQTERRRSIVERAQKEELLRKHLEFIQFVTDGHSYLMTWAEDLSHRLEAQTKSLKKETGGDYDARKIKAFLTYLDKESEKLDQVRTILEADVTRGNDLARQFRDGASELDNSDFNIVIVYDQEFEDLAYQARDTLLKHKFNVRKTERWTTFREDGDDGAMSRYFRDGPILWYDRSHKRTDEKIDTIKDALTTIFPDNMTLQRGDTVVVPGTTWHVPGAYTVQLWLFQKR
jgi:hypothetical protein